MRKKFKCKAVAATFFAVYILVPAISTFGNESSLYRVRTNYWTISLDHILSWKCAMILKFVSNTTQWMYNCNDLNAIKAISQEKHISLFDKMAALPTERSWSMLEFGRSNSVVAVQWAFWQQFGRCGSPVSSIWRRYEQFRDRGCICHQQKGRAGKPSITEETVERMCESFVRSPRKCVSRASRELQVPESAMRKVLRKRLQLYLYKLQLIQKLKPNDPAKWLVFCEEVLGMMKRDEGLSNRIILVAKRHFVYPERSTDTISRYGDPRSLSL
jgi:hypothetical protein